MKKRFTLLLLTSLFFVACSSTQQVQTIATDKTNQTYLDNQEKAQLVGYTTLDRLKEAPFKEWFNKKHTEYKVDKTILKGLEKKAKGVSVQLFMATWCRDSQREVPKFIKVMEELKMSENQINITNLYLDAPNYKQSPDRTEEGLNVHRVPTYIFYKDGEEIGRIVETPVNSLETDIAQILLGVPSKPKYKVVNAFQKLFQEKGKAYILSNKETLARRTRYSTDSSNELNGYGYFLLKRNKTEEAVIVFEINALAFPNIPNVFDSLAEGYIAAGRKDLAIENYEKVLKLDSENKQAKKMLEELKERS